MYYFGYRDVYIWNKVEEKEDEVGRVVLDNAANWQVEGLDGHILQIFCEKIRKLRSQRTVKCFVKLSW